MKVISVLTADELAAAAKVSKRQVWRWRDDGTLPSPISIGDGGRCLRWPESVIAAWIEAGCPNVRRSGWSFQSGNGNRRGEKS